MSCIQKYLVGLFVLTGFAVLAYAGGQGDVSFPTPLETYGDDEILENKGLMAVLSHRIHQAPFNLLASLTFLCAILHTFFAGKITAMAKKLEHAHVEKMREKGKSDAENIRRVHSIATLDGWDIKFDGQFFNEFTVQCPIPVTKVVETGKACGMLVGVAAAGRRMRGLSEGDELIIAVTEKRTKLEMDALVELFKELSA